VLCCCAAVLFCGSAMLCSCAAVLCCGAAVLMLPSADIVSPSTAVPMSPTTDEPPPSTSSSAPSLPASRVLDSIPCSTPAASRETLQQELLELKAENTRLKEELNVMLEHSIESDMRLLQLNEDVFVASTTSQTTSHSTVGPLISSFSADATNSVVTASAKTSPAPAPSDYNTIFTQSVAAVGTESSPAHIPADASNSVTAATTEDYLAIIASLKTTVEVLEAELAMYRNNSNYVTKDTFSYTKIHTKKASPVELENRFDVLTKDIAYPPQLSYIHSNVSQVQPSKMKKSKRYTHDKSTNISKKLSLSFKQLLLYGDSHVRHLGGLLSESVNGNTSVTGFCYPSARLESVIPSSSPPPESCCIIMAGTN
jgi:cell division protein FtsB